MSKYIEDWNDVIFISLGSVLGSYLRLKISYFVNLFFSRKYLGTLISNLSASFLLAFILSSNLKTSLLDDYQYYFMAINLGFIAGLSTFSTFVVDLLQTLLSRKWKQFYLISLSSLFGGILAVFLGSQMGHAIK